DCIFSKLDWLIFTNWLNASSKGDGFRGC
ncbi:hypothetical protein A2U01_0094455, partial [Trifolium medium]|nr:hypothetical protein [Trifolium medium]